MSNDKPEGESSSLRAFGVLAVCHFGRRACPRVDIYETDKELVLYGDLPGVAPADIDLRYERGELVLQGKIARPERRGAAIVSEYEEGDFYRVFQVHKSIDAAASRPSATTAF